MAKKVVKKEVKKPVHKVSKPAKKAAVKTKAKRVSSKLSLKDRVLHKHHRPLHVAAAGSLLMLLKGLFLFLGLGLVFIGAFVYLLRAARSTVR